MTTYREAIYMCLDLVKGLGDDFTYTEDHIAYLLDKYRAFLLKQRYGNDPKKQVPYSNYQSITFNLVTPASKQTVVKNNWGLVGTFNNWGNPITDEETQETTVIPDTPFELIEVYNTPWYVIKNITLTIEDEFKIRANNTWEGDIQCGSKYYNVPMSINTGVYLNYGGGENIKVSLSGTYDIYFDSRVHEFYILDVGKTPFDAGKPLPLSDDSEFYRSRHQIPYMLQLGIPRVSNKEYYSTNIEYTSRDRLPFIGNNRYLKNNIYCAIGMDNYLHFNSGNKEKLEQMLSNDFIITGIFENPREVTDETSFGETQNGDNLDRNIPIEEGLVPQLLELVVKELLGASYRPADITNNSADDMASLATFLANNMKSKFQKQMEA